jgi:LemA protein
MDTQKKFPVLWVVLGVIVVAVLYFISVGNQIVTLDQGVKAGLSQVDNVYQRRADLIPNLVSTVKGYAQHEANVFEEVTKARSQVGQVQIKSPNDIPKYQEAQGNLSSALSRLLVVAENYPQLKANENFRDLQAQLEGTENRITVERKRSNDAIQAYNSYIVRFPASFIANMKGAKTYPYFTADAQSKAVPKVEF